MESSNTYNTTRPDLAEGPPSGRAKYRSDEVRQNDASRVNEQLLYDAIKKKSVVHSGANWFYWIAGLSLLNSILFFAHSQWGFFVGLGSTDIINWLMSKTETGIIIGLGLSLGISAGFAALGYYAHRPEYRWTFITGILLYVLDSAILVTLGGWLSLIFHGYALINLYAGLNASRQLSNIEQQLAGLTPAQMISK